MTDSNSKPTLRTIWKPIRKWTFRLILLPLLLYFSFAFLLSYIPTGKHTPPSDATTVVYVVTNGLHVDLVFPAAVVQPLLSQGVRHTEQTRFVAFGWGDTDFYLQTRTWDDLKLSVAAKALFWPTETLMHVTHYNAVQKGWQAIHCSPGQLQTLLNGITSQFKVEGGKVLKLPDPGYYGNDDFYHALDSYSCFFTCNTWINDLLKQADLRAAAWTPFDFGVMHWHTPNGE